MRNIILGKSHEGKTVEIDLKILLRTRFLVQAASGGGKSRTLRRLAEQFFGKVPVWIIDKEDEFPSLRDKFGYVFAGPGGETPIDPRSAELVCERLLKARASAIFGLYTLKDPARHEWVRIFLNALMNAPKSLWTHMIVMVDESHKFCPEKGQGESVAREAMTDLAVDGRKRGFCAGYFTQRLGKLSKNASAELINRLIGKTVEDIDVDRAVELMSVRRSEREEFEYGIKRLPAGHFWSFGDAISVDRVLVHVGDIQTIHPEPGAPAMVLPPLPEKMKALLPQLADLPKEAETKARTEKELQAEIKRLNGELAKAKTAVARPLLPAPKQMPPPKPVIQTKTEIVNVEVPVIKPAEMKRLEAILGRAEGMMAKATELGRPFEAAAKDLRTAIAGVVTAAAKNMQAARAQAAPRIPPPPKFPQPVVRPAKAPSTAAVDQAEGEFRPSNPQLAILQTILEFQSIGIEVPTRCQIAGWLGIKVTGYFRTNLSDLRTPGYIDYRGKNGVVITPAGVSIAPEPEVEPTTKGILAHVLKAFSGPEGDMIKAVHRIHPEWMTREELAEAIGIRVTGYFRTNLSSLHVAEVIDYGEDEKKNHVKCADWMFIGQPASV